MHQLFPAPLDAIDPEVAVTGETRPLRGTRPWVLANMIATVDGATAVDGRSGGLGGSADKRMFAAVRAIADVVLVAAGTVRAEDYGPPTVSPAQREARVDRGQAPAPRLAVVTGSLDLDPTAPLFRDAHPDNRPLIFTVAGANAGRRAALTAVAEVVESGSERVDLVAAVAELGSRGARVVVAEGGPSLNGQLVADGLVDEWRITVAPLLAGGRSNRPAVGDAPTAPASMQLDRVLEEDGYLFLRYVRSEAKRKGRT